WCRVDPSMFRAKPGAGVSCGAGAALALMLSACLPFAAPPSRLTVAPGRAFGASGAAASSHGSVLLRGTWLPLDAVQALERRRFDVGVGYGAELPVVRSAAALHGPYLELSGYPLQWELSQSLRLQAGVQLAGEWLLRNEGAAGWGATLGFSTELLTSANDTFLSRSGHRAVLGHALGQWGIGLVTSAAFRSFEHGSQANVALGLNLRVPLLVGVLCCALPR
ncbi:MAG TPA: hypothetical protein VMF89_27645, partial [Polyangiales bacterium]|nr:hypothetical protein [Polyangiales bacterium]